MILFVFLEWCLSIQAQQTDSPGDTGDFDDDQSGLVYDYVVGFGGLAVGIISITILIICLCSRKGKRKKSPEDEEKYQRREARKLKRTERQTDALAKSHFEQLAKENRAPRGF